MNFSCERLHLKSHQYVIGVDEAGRGPLAGPVVAGAFCFAQVKENWEPDILPWSKIADSKAITEDDRESIYDQMEALSAYVLDENKVPDNQPTEEVVSEIRGPPSATDHRPQNNHPRIYYATASADAEEIDAINILEATLRSMTRATYKVIVQILSDLPPESKQTKKKFKILVDGNRKPPLMEPSLGLVKTLPSILEKHIPESEWKKVISAQMQSCSHETVVKGDAKILSIAAASIVAKVQRDRLMRQLDAAYPEFGWSVNKGYPTPEHKKLVIAIGPTKVHRLSFAPIYQALVDGKVEVPPDRDFESIVARISASKRKRIAGSKEGGAQKRRRRQN